MHGGTLDSDRKTLRSLPLLALLLSCPSFAAAAPFELPDAPSPVSEIVSVDAQTASSSQPAVPAQAASATPLGLPDAPLPAAEILASDQQAAPASLSPQSATPPTTAPAAGSPADADGSLVPLERQQPTRILGIMPNFRSVSGGSKPHPPGWKYNFTVATHQSLDYSTFVFLGLTSITAEGMDSHPALGKGVDGFYAYTWRGFLDKSDNTYLSAWLLASALHEDTRYYALGSPHRIVTRALYVISRQAVTRTYGGRDFPNFAGLGGKVLTQVVSRTYYPTSATSFSVLATKFGYSVMRDVAFSTVREFYPDIAAHYIRKHRARVLAQQQALAQTQQP